VENAQISVELSDKAKQLIARLRTIDTSADPLATGFDYRSDMAPLEEVLAEVFRALLRGTMTEGDADVVRSEARRIQHDFRARLSEAELSR
jgi:hypothetical protein